MSGFDITFDFSQARAFLDSVGRAVASDFTHQAAEAGARVLRDEVRANVSQLGTKTGNLKTAVYEAWSRDNSGNGRETFHVSWNHIKAPHGHLVESGHYRYYAVYIGSDGNYYTAIRPSQWKKPKPGRKQFPNYFVRLPVPVKIAGRHFVMNALDTKGQAARDAATEKMRSLIEGFSG